MFMKFDLFSGHHPEDFDAPVGADDPMPQQKICLNLGNIDNVQQSGQYQEIPVAPRPGEIPDELRGLLDPADLIEPGRRPRPVRPRAQQRRRQMFVIDNDRFVLVMKTGNNYTVMGKFDEFCDILCKFREKMETV